MATITTDDDLRDLLWRAGCTPAEIEVQMANPDVTTYVKAFLDVFNQKVAEMLAERIAEKLFPGLNLKRERLN